MGHARTKWIEVPSAYLIYSTEVLEKGFGSAEQSFILRADDDISNISLGTKRIQKKLLPVGQSKRRQHYEVVLITNQKSWNGKRLRRLICTCGETTNSSTTLINLHDIVYMSQSLISFHAPYDPLPAILWNCCQVRGP